MIDKPPSNKNKEKVNNKVICYVSEIYTHKPRYSEILIPDPRYADKLIDAQVVLYYDGQPPPAPGATLTTITPENVQISHNLSASSVIKSVTPNNSVQLQNMDPPASAATNAGTQKDPVSRIKLRLQQRRVKISLSK